MIFSDIGQPDLRLAPQLVMQAQTTLATRRHKKIFFIFQLLGVNSPIIVKSFRRSYFTYDKRRNSTIISQIRSILPFFWHEF
jgi:hypothetical protein